MNPELARKLLARQINGTVQPSPRQIQDYIKRPERDFVPPEELWSQMPPEIILKFTSNTGRLKEKKVRKFFRSLELFQPDYKPGDLLKIDVDCIDKNGAIIEENLRKILEGNNDLLDS